MRYGSVCSGIEAASAAWHAIGWRASFVSEIEPFPCTVLAHHYPDVPNFGDMTKFKEWPDAAIDVLVGGTPCQSFSVAGLRKGLADPRGNLMLTYLAIADRYRPRWLVWENVPGVLSSNGGRDFGTFLGGLGELGYGFAYRVLDAQYIRVESHARAVPQRRRRVFVVGCLGDWRSAAAVLFERESLCGHPPPRREAGKGVAPTISSRPTGGGGLGTDFDASEDGTGRGTPLVAIPFDTTQVTSAANYSSPKPGDPCHPLAAGAHAPCIAFSAKDHGADAADDVAPTLRAGGHSGSHANAGVMPAVAFAQNQRDEVRTMDVAGALAAEPGAKQQTYVATSAVRRLTPRECERLQGFLDDYTLIPYRNKPAADGPRYKALGNSMAVPCMFWIGSRIQLVEDIVREDATNG